MTLGNLGTRRCVRRLAALAAVGTLVATGTAPAAEDDAFVCMEESQAQCDYQNKNMELFIKGRDAFDAGRESGDLSDARGYAAELMARKDLQHGKGLMKFIYLQFAQGTHKNLVEAYRWVAADLAAGVEYKRLDLKRVLDQIAARMTPEQLAQIEK